MTSPSKKKRARKKNEPPPETGPRSPARSRVRKKTPLRPTDEARYWRRGRSSIHQRGLFAARDIPRGTRVIEYVGPRLTKAEGWKRATAWLDKAEGTDKGAVYVFELNSKYDIDGNVPWNTARLINHSCRPNCEPRIVRGHIWIVARRRIREDEELTYDYGYDFDHWEDHPCRCGADNCIGYIVGSEHRPRLRRELARRKAAGRGRAAQDRRR